MSSKRLCVTTYVYGNYKKFIPYYVYSILKSYPDYFVKIFVNGQLSTDEHASLERIKQQLSKNVEIKETKLLKRVSLANEGKARRFLLPASEFAGFDYVYIGDVDFLIIKEDTPLLEGHIEHCQKIGLPYSNQIRPQSKRLTGLHFIKTKEYYKKMDSLIAYYLERPEKIEEAFRTGIRDEEFLYNLVEKRIGFGDIDKHHYRPHHGFHLGILRNGPDHFKNYVEQGHTNPYHQLPPYDSLKKSLLAFYQDRLFTEIKNLVPTKEIHLLGQLLKQH
ncbi:hypothetical protein J32TS2_07470 [Shouchella clausii]|uniref:hypothetical protein n=1 Tax=Shouchella clausii TaxID=79880 RepID=UPI000BA523C9|nr:hypothetical protein [Shouchella clausii]PAD47642.1 hypothetical protein CHI09_05545 [Shouchella clausii]PAF09033.1 hypothetical protein CHH65_13460 [Shouchella clausii]GIN15391.1 hypothetical protein J32TS2_07470 [Shouchella clausii]